MSFHPLVDFSQMSLEELQEKQKEYTKKLYSIPGSSPLYDVVYSMKQAADEEYKERMFMETYKENKTQIESVTEIGTVSSEVTTPDYRDHEDKVVRQLAEFYSKKDSSNDQDS